MAIIPGTLSAAIIWWIWRDNPYEGKVLLWVAIGTSIVTVTLLHLGARTSTK